ncbi:5-hydroxytryptamine receptor 6-like [Saccoglossus kowalevskii]|uniref:5-hydroxytryptamine receptor 6-like n=1 Tax=Saccoglossus kowalevskii TaxID=10224 RepID=A0ABM0GU29_SACKO|nr:PREDICTED: 5-hydroxytryptamine receptor 6-like [Saccoglossus kowalevskii]
MDTVWNDSGNATRQSDNSRVAKEVLVGLVLSLIIAATIFGNTIVLIAVCKQKTLHTISNYFLVSLAMADLLVGIVVMPPAMLLKVFRSWLLGATFCSLWTSLNLMLTNASILSLCIISIDRYLLITQPLKYKQKMTPLRALILIVSTWIFAILTSFLPIQLQWYSQSSVPSTSLCSFGMSRTYALLASILLFFSPLALILYTYGHIFKAAREQALRIATAPAVTEKQIDETWISKFRQKQDNVKGKKAMKTLGIIVSAFLITWLPYHILLLIQAITQQMQPDLHTSLAWLGFCNSLINPIIYPMLIKDFRTIFIKFFKREKHVTRAILSSTMKATLSVVYDCKLEIIDPEHSALHSLFANNEDI